MRKNFHVLLAILKLKLVKNYAILFSRQQNFNIVFKCMTSISLMSLVLHMSALLISWVYLWRRDIIIISVCSSIINFLEHRFYTYAIFHFSNFTSWITSGCVVR